MTAPFWMWAVPAAAQDTSAVARLPTVTVTVTREVARSPLELPYAITAMQPDSLRPGSRQLALDEMLLLIPGIAVANRNNPTQDPRITIRGFGARSAFGVRGVKVLRDGVPLSLPDGQTPVDYIDLESVGSIEVIRGAASTLYGNASGGVIDLRTEAPPAQPFGTSLRAWGSEYASRRLHGTVGGTSDPFSYQASVTHTRMKGVRDYSRQETTHALARAQLHRGPTTWSVQAIGFDMPEAQNPGALTAAQFEANPRAAEVGPVATRARKDVRQGQLSLAASHATERADLSAVLYGGVRDLYNPLPFAIVAVDRASYGTTLRATTAALTLPGGTHRFSVGLDGQRQEDDRERFANCNGNDDPECSPSGTERGALLQSQMELVTGVGAYLRDELTVRPWLTASVGVRQDFTRFEVEDRFIRTDVTPADPDDSGERTLPATTWMVGLVARAGPLTSVYASISTAFETPTATEMGNQPDGRAGINQEIQPQRALSYEIGTKGFILPAIAYDAAIFLTDVENELVPFEVASGGGRRYFRNAGRTARRGLELGIHTETGPLRAAVAYSYGDYRFVDYEVTAAGTTTVYDDNRIPGIPVHQAQFGLTFTGRGLHATLETVAASRTLVDDANSASAAGYGIVNLRGGGLVSLGALGRIEAVVGAQNLLDRKYVGSVSVNASAAFRRYYEPAPGRVFFAGVTVAR